MHYNDYVDNGWWHGTRPAAKPKGSFHICHNVVVAKFTCARLLEFWREKYILAHAHAKILEDLKTRPK